MNPMVVFFHIPKAAGTSVREQIAYRLKPERSLYVSDISEIAYLSDRALNSYDFIAGHFGVQLLNRIQGQPIKLIFLRDPVARTRSQYQYLRRLAEMGAGSSFNHYDAVIRGRTLKEMLNDQQDVRINSWLRDTETWTLVKDYQHHYRYHEMSHAEVLDIAKENLAKMDYFGIVEFMDESFDLLNAKFGWSIKNDVRENVSIYDEDSADQHSTDEVIKEHNLLDVELYEYACKKFRQQIGMNAVLISPRSDNVEQEVSGTENQVRASSATIIDETANYHTLPRGLLVERIQRAERSLAAERRITAELRAIIASQQMQMRQE